MKIILFMFSTLFLFSYSDFISDGNDSKYTHLDHIVNTSESKIYLAIGYTPVPIKSYLVEIDTSSANVLTKEIADIDVQFNISVSKMLALTDVAGQYTGKFVLAGASKLNLFSYTSAAGITNESENTFNNLEIGDILDIVQRKDADGNLFIVSNKNDIFKDELDITTIAAHTFIDGAKIYDRYITVAGKNKVEQSYLAEINKDDVSIIEREFSYNLDGATDINADVAEADTFFTLGFDSGIDGGDITIFGSTPIKNIGTKLRALSVNATKIDTTAPILQAPSLLPPKFELLENQAQGTIVTVGSTVSYATQFDEDNADIIIAPSEILPVILPADLPFVMARVGNISKLVQGSYNATLGDPYNLVINWLDVNCSNTDPARQYIIPWSEEEIGSVQLINQKDDRVNYLLCQENDKFLYQQITNDQTLIKRQWEFVYPDETPIKWMQDVPNDEIIGEPPRGRIQTITTDNTSIVMLSQGNGTIGGINLLRVIDSTPGVITNRVKWHKTYFTGRGDGIGVNASGASVNGPNLLRTTANDFLLAGEITDTTRTEGTTRTDCMVIKFDKNGNELWTKNLGGFHDDNCYSVALEKTNSSPFYNDYIAVGSSGTRNPDDTANSETSYGVKFRDEGTLLHLEDGWSLIANGTDRNITAQGKKEESNTMGITHLGAYKSYFQFIKNQWLINQYPIEPLTGFWIYTIDGRHSIFLEGNLLEQEFKNSDLGWLLLGTGVKLVNTKIKFKLNALWKFKSGRWIENPTEINPGEGFWAKKKE